MSKYFTYSENKTYFAREAGSVDWEPLSHREYLNLKKKHICEPVTLKRMLDEMEYASK